MLSRRGRYDAKTLASAQLCYFWYILCNITLPHWEIRNISTQKSEQQELKLFCIFIVFGPFSSLFINNKSDSQCRNGITNSIRTLPLLLRNKSQTCARSQVLRKKIQRANSGSGTFINNIESIGQDGCMTGQSFERQIS